jgi:hypothetical protein
MMARGVNFRIGNRYKKLENLFISCESLSGAHVVIKKVSHCNVPLNGPTSLNVLFVIGKALIP